MDGWNEELHIKCYLTECSFNSALRLIQLANETTVQIWCLFAIQNYLQTNCKNLYSNLILCKLNISFILHYFSRK